jgi:hypothetical protein
MTTIRGKQLTIGRQTRFFPALSPGGALDSAPEREDDETHDAAMEHVADCSDEQAEQLQGALDRRAGARARDARRARDEGEPSREEAYLRARDAGDPDHRNDFRPAAAGGPDAKDSRMAHDRARGAAANVDIDAIFRTQA